jgi:hypothetical protein
VAPGVEFPLTPPSFFVEMPIFAVQQISNVYSSGKYDRFCKYESGLLKLEGWQNQVLRRLAKP